MVVVSAGEPGHRSSMHVVSVAVTVKPELLEEFERAILHNARESVARDPGCFRFDVSQVYKTPRAGSITRSTTPPRPMPPTGSLRTFWPTR